jgi:hypothetical protein
MEVREGAEKRAFIKFESCSLLFGRKWKVFEYRRPSIDRFRIRIDEEKANLSRSGNLPDMGIPFRRVRLEKSPIELATEDVKKSTALALYKGIPDSVNYLVDIETKSH